MIEVTTALTIDELEDGIETRYGKHLKISYKVGLVFPWIVARHMLRQLSIGC